MSNGYIKLHRSILKWEWINDPNTLRLWVHLLCTVNWDHSKYRGIDVSPGQRIVSLTRLAEETNLTVRQVRTAKGHLIDTGEVTATGTPYGDLLTVENWGKYQGSKDENDTESDTAADNQATRNATSDRHAIEEEREEYKNYYSSAHAPAQAHTRATTKEERLANFKKARDEWRNHGRIWLGEEK